MSRYIEYEPLMAELEREVELADDWKTAHEIANVAKYAPTIEIVRCRECKHNYNTAINHGKMQPRCDFTDYKLTENDFCSRGEREGE